MKTTKMTPIINITKSNIQGSPGFKATLNWTNVPKGVKDGQMSWILDDESLAKRFKKAVEAGKVFTNPKIVDGGGMIDPETNKMVKPFKRIKYDGFMMVKYMNSDLKKLGF